MRPIEQTIQATGSVAANETRVAHMRALARGRIDEVSVQLGDRVRGGQRLLTYDNVELGEAIGEYLAALAELQRAGSETEVAGRALERAGNLVELGAVARAELQRREAEHSNALANVERQKAGAAKVEEKLHRFGMTDAEIGKLDPRKAVQYHRERSHSALVAPFGGVITALDAVPGETVGTEGVLITVADLSLVWVQADVYEKDIRAVKKGQQARVLVAAYPGRTFAGEITYLSDVLDPNTRTAKVRCEVPNPEHLLKLEMFATVEIPVPAGRDGLMIPESAVQQIDGQPAAFVPAGRDRFARRALQLGVRCGDWIEVTGGLTEGESVVTEGSFLLKSQVKKSELGHHED
jgi:cobalt-zinc-cadmium efflux system membrane fusion protein